MTDMQSNSPDTIGTVLIVVGMTGPEPGAVLQTLGVDLQDSEVLIFETPAALVASRGSKPVKGEQILALATSCSAYLAGSMAAGLNPAEAGETWRKALGDFVALCQERRATTLVLDANCACSVPEATRQALVDRFAHKLAGENTPSMVHVTAPILHLLAQYMTSGNTNLRHAQSELETLTKQLDSAPAQPVLDANTILQDFRATQQKLQQAQVLATEQGQATTALQQTVKAVNLRSTQVIEDSEAELRAVRRDLDKSRQYHATVESQCTATAKQLRDELAATLATLQITHCEVAELRSSTSWKVTKPLRKVRHLISPRKYRTK
jgi:hypothetical protein